MSLATAADASLLVVMKPARVAWLRFWDSIILLKCMLCALVWVSWVEVRCWWTDRAELSSLVLIILLPYLRTIHMVLLLFYFKVHTTVSSSTVSREKSRFSPFTIPTVSLYEKYGD